MWKAEAITSTAKDRQRFNLVHGCILIHTGEKDKNSRKIPIHLKYLSDGYILGGSQHPHNTAHAIWAVHQCLRCLWSLTQLAFSVFPQANDEGEGDTMQPILNSALPFAIFTTHLLSVTFPCTGTLSFLLDGVFLIRSLLTSLAIGSLLNIFLESYIASVCMKQNNNSSDYKTVTGRGGEKGRGV